MGYVLELLSGVALKAIYSMAWRDVERLHMDINWFFFTCQSSRWIVPLTVCYLCSLVEYGLQASYNGFCCLIVFEK